MIDKPILQLLGIGLDSEIEVVTDGRSLILSPPKPQETEGDLLEVWNASIRLTDEPSRNWPTEAIWWRPRHPRPGSLKFSAGGAFGGEEFHSSIFDKAAAYLFHLCQNHAFVDGNKRVGLAAALVFLDLNGIVIEDPQGELYALVIAVAAGQANKTVIAETLKRLAVQ